MMADNDNRIDEDEDEAPDYAMDGDQEGGVFRWMSVIVVLLAIAGFFGLAWYAYKSGGDVVDEHDAELVLADTTPVKEAPANPGGMTIPNQDKTVYGLVGGKGEEPKVAEHILGAPETPVTRNEDGDTGTWMSDQVKDKLKSNEADKAPSDILGTKETAKEEETKEEPKIAKKEEPVKAEEPAAGKTEQFQPAKSRETAKTDGEIKELKLAGLPETKTPAEVKPVPVEVKPKEEPKKEEPKAEVKAEEPKATEPKKEEPKEEVKKEELEKEEAPKEEKKPEVKKPEEKKAEETKPTTINPTAGARAQLGAFKSEQEAEGQWKKIVKKFASEVRGKEHYVVRADLGAKGIYYRLQLAPFDSTKEAETFCIDLVSEGQGCIPAKGK